jgi:hypothetical protein
LRRRFAFSAPSCDIRLLVGGGDGVSDRLARREEALGDFRAGSGLPSGSSILPTADEKGNGQLEPIATNSSPELATSTILRFAISS